MRRAALVGGLVGMIGFCAFSLSRGQEQPTKPTTRPRRTSLPLPSLQPVPTRSPRPTTSQPEHHRIQPALAVERPSHKGSLKSASPGASLSALQKEMLLSARRGADWLFQMNDVKGRFLTGYLPALRTPVRENHFLRQAGAAVALARAARFTREKRLEARATQTVLTLLAETKQDGDVRYPDLPPTVINHLGAAGLLVLAIHELPEPQKDLLQQSDQLCNFIRKQARADGSLRHADTVEEINQHPGVALCALMHSQQHRPAPWKTALVRKAATHYRRWWKSHRNPEFVPWQTAAYTQAFVQSKDPALASFVHEMNDWLCTLQYNQIQPEQMLWYGGFCGWSQGNKVRLAPTIESARYAESLADACRVARTQGDAVRYKRYRATLERSLQFLVTLQYTEASTQHFASWYRRRLIGGFHASHQDGTVRIDYNQYAVCALIRYLEAR